MNICEVVDLNMYFETREYHSERKE